MAAPSKTKTWTKYSTYVATTDGPPPQPGGQTDRQSASREVFYRLKTTFLAAGWTVVSSCGKYDDGGGEAWHYGAADHWPSAVAVRWKEPDNKYGWIVLRNTNLHAGGNGFQVCIALTGTINSTQTGTMGFSCEGGFSGGSDMARPTATDEVIVFNNELWTGYSLSSFENNAMNIWYTSDGTSFRLWWGNGISNLTLNINPPWMFERLVDAPSWMDKPVVAGYMRWDMTHLFNVSSATRRLYFCCEDFLKCETMITAESDNAGVLIKHVACQSPDIGGRWPVFSVSVISQSAFVNGYVGKLADLWAIPEALAFGDYMPGDGSYQFVVMNDLLLANDGTTVILP